MIEQHELQIFRKLPFFKQRNGSGLESQIWWLCCINSNLIYRYTAVTLTICQTSSAVIWRHTEKLWTLTATVKILLSNSKHHQHVFMSRNNPWKRKQVGRNFLLLLSGHMDSDYTRPLDPNTHETVRVTFSFLICRDQYVPAGPNEVVLRVLGRKSPE